MKSFSNILRGLNPSLREAETSSTRSTAQTRWFNDIEAQQAVMQILTNGYVIVKGAIAPDTLRDALDAYDRYKTSILTPHASKLGTDAFENGKFRRLVNLHAAIPELQSIFSKNKALKILDALFGSPATLYTSLFFEIGSGQDLHRDTPYFWTNPGHNYFGVWTALEPTDADNGALIAVPGSHLLPDTAAQRQEIGERERQAHGTIASDSPRLWDEYQRTVQQQAMEAGLTPKELHVDAGDTIIWHPQLLHGGAAPRSTNRSRKSFVMHVTPENVKVVHQDYFFAPDRHFDGREACAYTPHLGRHIRTHQSISIAHKVDIKVKA